MPALSGAFRKRVWLFPYRHLCIHLLAKTVSPRIERPIRHCGLQRKVERRADAEIGPATSVHEVVHDVGRAFSADP
jgi:hypothetical protein